MPNSKPGVQQRAAALSRRINAALKSGEFVLDAGYASTPDPLYESELVQKGVKCQGCALAAAAFALTREPMDKGQSECLEIVTEKITADDAAQLECGFERWTNTKHTTIHTKKDGHIVRREKKFKARPTNAFYKLGKKLRARRDEEWSSL